MKKRRESHFGIGHGGCCAQTKKPAASQDQVPNIIPVDLEPATEPALSASQKYQPPSLIIYQIIKGAYFLQKGEGVIKNYQSDVFNAALDAAKATLQRKNLPKMYFPQIKSPNESPGTTKKL